ncbi:hypothetical protein CARUB_v10005736mg [Capsella rubella]|uniref:EF-hand domain-containing protein n=1 Tax=Capsella rubella TaxID=81985 RepID=R0F6I9_9BRAS|nr:uncharacterized protein LOC17878376 isoform X2 [Capsella rubella]EOA17432.1 hypothetical protein CARUB_v10005736mg [Capsella rubella]
MDELHEAAIAYYNNGSREQQDLAWHFFRAMDNDGDGRVSFQEYIDFLHRTAGLAWVCPEMFRELDRNRDGQLDFWEVLTLYYVARTRTISCRTCLQSLSGLHFTCVTCFDTPGGETFDLCVKCYMRRNYTHSHCLFLDSYVLLRSKRSPHHLPPCDENLALQQPLQQEPDDENLEEQQPRRMGWWDALNAMETAIAVGHLATFCTIM